jgi:predicted metal-binding membrane protein
MTSTGGPDGATVSVVHAALPRSASGGTAQRRASRGAFLAVAVLLLAASTAGTLVVNCSMAGMGGMPMPGGWTLSMAWMRMPGQTWPQVALSFLGMWGVMMAAMMLPAVLPLLWRYRRALAGTPHPNTLTLLALAGYFSVWTLWALAVFPAGAVLAELTLASPPLARSMPAAAAVLVLGAGGVQLSAWKARALCGCRARRLPPAAGSAAALRHGLVLGMDCSRCCGNLMLILPATGVMDLRVMALVTAAIVLERQVSGIWAARLTGVLTLAAGALLLARAAGLPA